MVKHGKFRKTAFLCLVVFSAVAYLTVGAQAEVVIDYTGGDPEAVGWSLVSSGACTAALVDDAGTSALQIIDPTTASGEVWELSMGNRVDSPAGD